MKSISEFSIRKPATATMFIISMIFFGILGLKKMPIEMLPNINKPTVRIRIKWDGATPSDVDKMITRKIEDVERFIRAKKAPDYFLPRERERL